MTKVVVLLIATTLGSTSLSSQTVRRSTTPVPTAPPPSQSRALAPSGLTNQDILKMVQAGVAEAIVRSAIRAATTTSFDLSPDGLIALKRGGVSDAIVALMMDPKAAAPAAPAASPGSRASADTVARVDSAIASPAVPREAGIYWDRGREAAHDLVVLEPTVFSQGKTGGLFTSALTYGIKKVKLKAVTRGSAAGLHIDEYQPTFYFYFENKGSGLSNSGGFSGWLSGASSPNEFILARMTSKSKERELIVGEVGAFGGSSGARSKDTIDLQVDRLSGGVYRVKSQDALEAGEYCFFYAGGMSALGTGGTGKLFDFGIYDPSERRRN